MSKLSYQNIIHSKPGDSYCSYESPGLYDYLYGIMLARRVCDEQTEKASRLCVLAPMPLCRKVNDVTPEKIIRKRPHR